jgi:uncharacterized protein (TIRG00374 family)
MKFLFLTFKIILSGIFLFLAFRVIEIKDVTSLIQQNPFLLIGVFILFLIQNIMAAFRLRPILKIFKSTISATDSLKNWLVGLFTSQTLITFVAGDAFRVWYLTKNEIDLKTATKAIVFDRVFGLALLLLFCFFSLLFLMFHVTEHNINFQVFIFLLIVLSALCGFLLSPFLIKLLDLFPQKYQTHEIFIFIKDLFTIVRTGFQHKILTLQSSLMGMMMHFMNAIILGFILFKLGADISFFEIMLITFPVILISLLPISFAGWGIRETSLASGLALFGVSSSIAITASVFYGIGLLLSSLPGGFLLLQEFWRNKK